MVEKERHPPVHRLYGLWHFHGVSKVYWDRRPRAWLSLRIGFEPQVPEVRAVSAAPLKIFQYFPLDGSIAGMSHLHWLSYSAMRYWFASLAVFILMRMLVKRICVDSLDLLMSDEGGMPLTTLPHANTQDFCCDRTDISSCAISFLRAARFVRRPWFD